MVKRSETKVIVRSRRPALPLPGRRVKGSQSGRPIMAALSLLSRRWVLRIIWELRKESCGFREIQARCDRMSPNTLSTRLAELREAGIVSRNEDGSWALTKLGRKLRPAMRSLANWSDDWADALQRAEVKK